MIDARRVLLAAAALLVASCGASDVAGPPATSAPAKHDMALELTAHLKGGTSGIARKNDAPGAECGTSGFTKPTDPLAFMRPGNESLLQDEHGTTIAKGSFDVGTTSNLNAATNEFDCTWRVEFKDVPETGFYDLSIAGHDVANISQAEAKAANWEVPLTLTW